jgi:hypothetical protein
MAHNFRNGFRVDEVVLVRLHKGPHEPRRKQSHLMALLPQGATQEGSA